MSRGCGKKISKTTAVENGRGLMCKVRGIQQHDSMVFCIVVYGFCAYNTSLVPRPSNIFQCYCEKNREGLVDLLT